MRPLSVETDSRAGRGESLFLKEGCIAVAASNSRAEIADLRPIDRQTKFPPALKCPPRQRRKLKRKPASRLALASVVPTKENAWRF